MTPQEQAMSRAFNEWMRRYIEEPERFEREWRAIERFQCEEAEGETPGYGVRCAAYLVKLMCEGP